MEKDDGAAQPVSSLVYLDAQLAATELTAEEKELVEVHRMHIAQSRQVRAVPGALVVFRSTGMGMGALARLRASTTMLLPAGPGGCRAGAAIRVCVPKCMPRRGRGGGGDN